jgi:hypothetical protein
MVDVKKQDYMGECNVHNVPLEDFTGQFCSRCLQPECGRSQHGQSRFEKRIATWETRLFTGVPKMNPSDPRYSSISAKKFLSIDPGPAPEIGRSAWVDPRDLDEPPPKPQNVEAPPPPVQVTETAKEKTPEPPPAPPTPPAKLGAPAPMNTPARSNVMIGPAKPPAPKSDPWEPKRSAGEGVIVKPGAKIRMGGTPSSGV